MRRARDRAWRDCLQRDAERLAIAARRRNQRPRRPPRNHDIVERRKRRARAPERVSPDERRTLPLDDNIGHRPTGPLRPEQRTIAQRADWSVKTPARFVLGSVASRKHAGAVEYLHDVRLALMHEQGVAPVGKHRRYDRRELPWAIAAAADLPNELSVGGEQVHGLRLGVHHRDVSVCEARRAVHLEQPVSQSGPGRAEHGALLAHGQVHRRRRRGPMVDNRALRSRRRRERCHHEESASDALLGHVWGGEGRTL